MSVLIVTSLGEIVVDLHTDKCPLTCKNFLKLCKIKYYNGCLFHTVQKDFTAQTGDPTGTGSGGDSVYKFLYGDQARFFNDEIHLDLKHSKTGTIAMASAGENLNASQFYLTLRDNLDYLDGKHTIFGEIAEGFETLTRINEAYVDENNRPYKNIRIKHTYILDDPFDDPSQLAELIPDASPEGKPKDEVDDNVRLEDDWVPLDEQLGPLELEERLRAKDAHSSAVVLESIGDIPDVEIKPPDNVLFVCKLNPVTEDEDLHTIFSRFGTVQAADIIRDFKTGDSLCYAFIEFETREACEQAYFKMDNALIDDRRIHVDFSQSVAKLWSQYRRKDQKGKGKGCFKCGALDHIAKDCTGDPANTQQPQKYILKDDNGQRGGGKNSSYDMVFDGDTPEIPRQEKRGQGHNNDCGVEKQRMNKQSSEEPRHRDRENKDSCYRDRHSDRSRGYREDSSQDGKANRSSGSRSGRDRLEEGRDRDRHKDGQRDTDDKTDQRESRKRDADDGIYADRRGEKDYRKRSTDSDRENHKERQRNIDNKVDQRESGKRYADDGERGGVNYRKRSADSDRLVGRSSDSGDYRKNSVERRDETDYKKRHVDGERRDKRDDRVHKKRSADVDAHGGTREREHRRR
ncbi:peptidyl-prolyl cis-trans isomerase CYP59-like [Pyrus x bretschneideri]|uniref:peptidyl-prolyl cis-trans isomerase CYP59-like n=1 Tax=Pyrus x bretschneideri TaxID=225117 RepID=UPI00202E1957|nr:peptidyl-prolyl cis-trans isomerase CYP59-like [Pyrus x bretschneideri]